MNQVVGRRSFVKKGLIVVTAAAGALAGFWAYLKSTPELREAEKAPPPTVIKLSSPKTQGLMSVEEALAKRRSVREYSVKPLTLQQLSQLMWAAQGITLPQWGFRTSPSAGATYPLELYVVVGEDGVLDLDAGVYHYDPKSDTLNLQVEGDRRAQLSVAALDQEWVAEARINIVITALFQRTTERYGERGVRYVYMEAGHVSQNIYLQAVALGLATVTIGAFYDEQVQKVLALPEAHKPLYIQPVAYPK